jgi:hypothetical protein
MDTFKRRWFAAALAALSLSAFGAEAPVTDAEADAGAILACMEKGKDGQSQSTCVMGLALIKAVNALGAGRGIGAPPQVVVQQPNTGRTGWDVFSNIVLGVTQFAKEAFQTVAPVAAQVYAARTNAHTQEVVAGYNAQTQIAMVQGFQNLGTAGIQGTTNAAGLGFTAVSNVAGHIPQPGAVTTYNLSGNSVLASGPGNVSYTPITGSYNPINPNPLVVNPTVCSGTPLVCTR